MEYGGKGPQRLCVTRDLEEFSRIRVNTSRFWADLVMMWENGFFDCYLL